MTMTPHSSPILNQSSAHTPPANFGGLSRGRSELERGSLSLPGRGHDGSKRIEAMVDRRRRIYSERCHQRSLRFRQNILRARRLSTAYPRPLSGDEIRAPKSTVAGTSSVGETDFMFEKLLSIEEKLCEELSDEELLKQFEAYVGIEEDYLIMDQMELERYAQEFCSHADETHAFEVACPICVTRALFLVDNFFRCTCGFEFPIREECASLENLRERLQIGFEMHASHPPTCFARPHCAIVQSTGIKTLCIRCLNCNFLYTVL